MDRYLIKKYVDKMLPSDFSPEKQMRQRFVQREADMREATLNRDVTISFTNVGKRVEAMKAAVAQGWTTEKEISSFSFRDVRFTAQGSKPLGKLATLMKKFRGSVSNSQLPHGGLTGQGGSTIVKPT